MSGCAQLKNIKHNMQLMRRINIAVLIQIHFFFFSSHQMIVSTLNLQKKRRKIGERRLAPNTEEVYFVSSLSAVLTPWEHVASLFQTLPSSGGNRDMSRSLPLNLIEVCFIIPVSSLL